MTDLIFFTDLHLAGNPPGQRRGPYSRDLLTKLEWIVERAKVSGAILIFGGDFVHTPNASLQVVNEAAAMISTLLPHHFLYVLGQHDLVGHSPSSLFQSGTSILHWVNQNSPQFREHYIRRGSRDTDAIFALHSHCPSIDANMVGGCWPEEDVDIAVVHAPIGFKVPLELVQVRARVLLCGDYHEGFSPVKVRGTAILNPGATSRVSIADYERVPKILEMSYDEGEKKVGSWAYVPIPCRDKEEIFDLGKHLEGKQVGKNESVYVTMIREAATGVGHQTEDMLDSMEVEEEVRRYVQEKLEQAQKAQT